MLVTRRRLVTFPSDSQVLVTGRWLAPFLSAGDTLTRSLLIKSTTRLHPVLSGVLHYPGVIFLGSFILGAAQPALVAVVRFLLPVWVEVVMSFVSPLLLSPNTAQLGRAGSKCASPRGMTRRIRCVDRAMNIRLLWVGMVWIMVQWVVGQPLLVDLWLSSQDR